MSFLWWITYILGLMKCFLIEYLKGVLSPDYYGTISITMGILVHNWYLGLTSFILYRLTRRKSTKNDFEFEGQNDSQS